MLISCFFTFYRILELYSSYVVTYVYIAKLLSSVCMDDGNLAWVDSFPCKALQQQYPSPQKRVWQYNCEITFQSLCSGESILGKHCHVNKLIDNLLRNLNMIASYVRICFGWL